MNKQELVIAAVAACTFGVAVGAAEPPSSEPVLRPRSKSTRPAG